MTETEKDEVLILVLMEDGLRERLRISSKSLFNLS